MNKNIILTFFLLFVVCVAMAQSNYSQCYLDNIRKGNEAYAKGKYKEARTFYVKAKQCSNGNPDNAQRKINMCDEALHVQSGNSNAEEKEKVSENIRETEKVQLFSISPTSAVFPSKGGKKSFTITSSADWIIDGSTEFWAHLERHGNDLDLSVDENTGESRNGSFALKSGEKTIKVTFTQEQADTFFVSKDHLNFSASGGTKDVTVTSTQPWRIGSENSYGWDHIQKNENTIKVKVDPNVNTTARKDDFTVQSGSKTIKIMISQEGNKDYLRVNGSANTIVENIYFSGGERNFSVSTYSGSYTIEGLPYWCRIKYRSSSGFTLVCEKNKTEYPRECRFYVKTEGETVQIEVKQTKNYHIADLKRRFPSESEWQNMIGFNAGVIGHYHNPVDVYNSTIGLFTGKGIHFEEKSSFAWDASYIGGGLFSKCFFVGFGLGASGYINKAMHKKDITVPLFLHVKWYMAGNSAVSPYIATSQGIDIYICQDYAQTHLVLGPHARFDLGIHIRPDLYSKFGISIACEFGFAPYRITDVINVEHQYYYNPGGGSPYNFPRTIFQQLTNVYSYSHASYIGGYFAFVF